MRILPLILTVYALCFSSLPTPAAELGATRPAKPHPEGIYQGDGRTGGDTIEDAVPIPSVPFHDTGNTCGFSNDYDEVCPYSGSTAPDVVYRYVPLQSQVLNIYMCTSTYDTKVYVYDGAEGNLVGCNDDGCTYGDFYSWIRDLEVEAWHTYYVVVDGWGPACGAYVLDIWAVPPCAVVCPPGAIEEGEPPCRDEYHDSFNGGCSSSPHLFQPIRAQSEGCATLCGKSCTYSYQGNDAQDSDWFDCIGLGQMVTARCTAEFPQQFIFIYTAYCGYFQYDVTYAGPCQTATIARAMAAGTHLWLLVRPQYDQGIPEGDYVLEVCGIAALQPGACCFADASCRVLLPGDCGYEGGSWQGEGTVCEPNPCPLPVPTQRSTWGRIKVGYR